jgi:hypothetical protein
MTSGKNNIYWKEDNCLEYLIRKQKAKWTLENPRHGRPNVSQSVMEPEMLLAFLQVFATEPYFPASYILFFEDPFKYHISLYV